MKSNIFKISFGVIVLSCIAFFIITMTPSDAKPWDFPIKGPCNRLGVWYGEGDQGYSWMVVETPGWNAISGQFTVEWIELDPTLGGFFPEAVRATNAVGVWEKVGRLMYEYTWIAYGLDEDSGVLYTARASGEAELVDCDNVDMDYVLEFWPGKIVFSTDPNDPVPEPIFTTPRGFGSETRMPLVQTSPGPELPPAP